MVKALQVAATREGFRRLGRRLGREPVIVRCDELTDDEIKRLKDDPHLVVIETDLPDDTPPEKQAAKTTAKKPAATRGAGAKA